MAVVGTASEMAEGREAIRGENGRRGYRRRFVVQTDNAYDDPDVVLSAALLPGMYDQYATTTSTDLGARVIRIVPTQAPKSRTVWYVDVEYDTQFERIDNPFTELPEIDWGGEPYQEPQPGTRSKIFDPLNTQSPDPEDLGPNATLSAWGKGILNSAGHPYSPPPERAGTRPTVTFTRNQSTFTTAFKVQYEDAVNKYPWNGLQARQAYLKSINAQGLIWKSTTFNIPDRPYYRVSYVFALKAETWDLQLLDYGPYYLTWTGGGLSATPPEVPKATTFRNASGDPIMGLLSHTDTNKPGQKLGAGADPQFNRYPVRREADFSALGIDLNLALTAVKTTNRS